MRLLFRLNYIVVWTRAKAFKARPKFVTCWKIWGFYYRRLSFYRRLLVAILHLFLRLTVFIIRAFFFRFYESLISSMSFVELLEWLYKHIRPRNDEQICWVMSNVVIERRKTYCSFCLISLSLSLLLLDEFSTSLRKGGGVLPAT